ncbi:DUF1700 domain-containing protein [Oscillospiraceae bacterium PP1C4]
MNKFEFILMLESKLKALPQSEIDKSISYFSEIIDDRVEDGMNEEEAVASLENVDDIVEKIMLDISLPVLMKARIKENGSLSPLNIVLLVLGFPIWFPLLMAAFAVSLAFYVSVWAIIISLYAVILSLVIAGIVGLVSFPVCILRDIPSGVFALGCSLLSTGIAILLFHPIAALSKLLIRLTEWALRKIKILFIRKEVD